MRLLRTLLQRLPHVALLTLLLGAPPLPTANADAFQIGWAAYERGDYAQAVDSWLPLAQQGNVSVQINLAVMYDHGTGVTQDIERALSWYQVAAHQGSAIAQYNLGLFLADRNLVTTDDEDGLYWLFKAAAQNYADAQYQLGLMYAEGVAGQAKTADAPQWLYQAGVNYLSSGDTNGARSAVTALQEISSAYKLSLQLESQLAEQSKPLQQNFDDTPESGVSTGTAWSTASGYAVTNHHVVSGKQSIVLVDSQGEEIPATVAASDELNDIALLSVGDPARLPAALPLACASAQLGSSVFTIGFPRVDIMGTTPKLSLGIISSVNGLYDDPASYQISVPVQPGNSGGPLLNMQGEVVGLITSMLGTVESANGKTRPIANINYALKADRIEKLLLELPRQARKSNVTVLTSGRDSLETLADRIQNSVMIVRAGTSLSP
ncbi:MAG: tetratricopeptide repeat-containing serine protease family protein [Pseudomonadota bacterium]|nr:tetratricopeptide repeat-containing serine protease family protein [Pseudomonadota bacterium]